MGLLNWFRKSQPKSTDNDRDALKAMSGFAAARKDRFSDDWIPGQTHPATLHRMDAATMRERARDLIINNPFAAGGVDAYIANVIERGITPKAAFDNPDERNAWSSAWAEWCGKYDNEADITGQQHLYDLQALWLEEIIVGGGCLMHFVDLPRSRDRRLPLAIELIPEERLASDNGTLIPFRNKQKSGNRIVGGVELDSATGKAVAYWIKPQDLTGYDLSIDPIRLPAEDCRYAFFKKRIGQYRGYTLLHAAIMWLWKLGYYTDNELMASAIKSCYAAVITTKDDYAGMYDGDPNGPTSDAYNNQMEKLQPAMVARLRPGEGITGVGPNIPGSDGEAWIVFIERAIGVAMGLSYEEFFRDYSKGNFSSVRASANADRKRFKRMQQFAVNNFCSPVYKRFAMSAVRAGLDGFPRPAVFAGAIDEYLAVNWRCPGWETVNPIDDARADDLGLKNGSKTLEEIASAKGGADWEEKLEQRSREQNKIDDLELRIEVGAELTDTIASPGSASTEGGRGN